MPISPQDAAELKAQGWSDEEIANAIPAQAPQQPQGHSLLGTAALTAGAHLGGYAGGGAGFLGATALAAPWLLGPEAGIPADIALGAAGVGGGLLGGAVGQKAQDTLTPGLEQQAQQAAQEGDLRQVT